MRQGERGTIEAADFADLIEAVPAIVYVAELGAGSLWHYVSPQVEMILGYTPEEWIADSDLWIDSVHPEDREYAVAFEHERYIDLASYPPAEYRMRRKDGEYIWILEKARLIRGEDGVPLWHGVMQDITGLKTAETNLRELARKQELTSHLGGLAMSGVSTDELFRAAVESLVELPGIHGATVRERTETNELHLLSAAAHHSHDQMPSQVIPFDPEGMPGKLLLSGNSIWVDDWEQDPIMSVFRKHLASPKVRSTMVVPIDGHSRQFGTLILNSEQPHRFGDNDNHFVRAVANVLSSAVERERIDRSTSHRLHHDPLTELPNRQLFTDRLEEAIEGATEVGTPIAVLFLDLDHFKLINDGIGHHAGDELLREVAPRLSAGVRQRDTVSRFGGDEFGIVLNGVTDEANAREIAGRVLDSLAEPIVIDQAQHYVTASIGIALYRPGIDQHRSAAALIEEADAAMYQAKELGRSQAQVFDKPMQDRAVERGNIERELQGAIERDELVLHYQPTISLETGEISKFEALVRWNHPARGLLGPLEFIPIAEESDLITKIDTWVLAEACRQNAIWNRNAVDGRSYTVAVNTSARQVRTRHLPELVQTTLERFGLEPAQLELEITESVLLVRTDRVRQTLAELNEIGVWLALDDFGTGFSALSYLSEFPFDMIKIDRSFVEQLGAGQPEGSAITEAIINIGAALSLTTVAEAVGTEAQLHMLRDLGCHYCQGFLVSPPLPAPGILELLKDPARSYLPGESAANQSP